MIVTTTSHRPFPASWLVILCPHSVLMRASSGDKASVFRSRRHRVLVLYDQGASQPSNQTTHPDVPVYHPNAAKTFK